MRGFVFIDGSNFYHKLKDLTAGRKQEFPLSSFDFHAFAAWLTAPGELAGVRYYIGAVKRDGSEKSQALYTDQQRLIGRLQQQGVEIVLGRLIRHPDRTNDTRFRVPDTCPAWVHPTNTGPFWT